MAVTLRKRLLKGRFRVANSWETRNEPKHITGRHVLAACAIGTSYSRRDVPRYAVIILQENERRW
ncbi:MAG: hypothetical protein OJF49_001596 [Ktedonobacterales bacterium]|jgi:hypothetical protein|nr:MAG: hypothetical protein OJF49_001596 [Ktedonobacterales bacterium]